MGGGGEKGLVTHTHPFAQQLMNCSYDGNARRWSFVHLMLFGITVCDGRSIVAKSVLCGEHAMGNQDFDRMWPAARTDNR